MPNPGKGRGTWTRGTGGCGEDAMQEMEGRLLEPEGVGLRRVLSIPFRNRLHVVQIVSVQFSSVQFLSCVRLFVTP